MFQKIPVNRLLALLRQWWLPLTVALLSAIALLTLWPSERMPTVPGGDRLHHLIAYAALVFPVAFCRPRYWRCLVLLFVAWGGVLELLQPYFNRHNEWQDFLANILGVVFGLLMAHLLRYLEARNAP
ncbi:MAG: hypothetical protein K6L73_08615 [Cellvibrionaceae bacterium]